MGEWQPTHSRAEVEDAVAASQSLSAALRRLGLRVGGGNRRTLVRLIRHYEVSTDHFDSNWRRRLGAPVTATPLEEVMVERSTYARGHLKRRLYESGLKRRRCELCGQDENWRGQLMSLILDHVNGVGDDHRLENLRIVCPTCAATLDTHCGRRNRIDHEPRMCRHCAAAFVPRYPSQTYCSRGCAVHSGPGHAPRPAQRKVPRPPYDELVAEIAMTSWSAVARRHGVSDNAVRKWVRWYEADAARRGEADDDGR